MIGDMSLAKPALGQLQSAFGRFAANKQKFPLVHESEFDTNRKHSMLEHTDRSQLPGAAWYRPHHM